MEKSFDIWNSRKKEIDSLDKKSFYKEREIWWCSLGVNIGVETDGKNENFERPVLIIKVFNSEMVWILPITGKPGPSAFYFKIKYQDQLRWVITSQIRTVSTKRLLRKIEFLEQSDFEKIQNLIVETIKKAKPRQ